MASLIKAERVGANAANLALQGIQVGSPALPKRDRTGSEGAESCRRGTGGLSAGEVDPPKDGERKEDNRHQKPRRVGMERDKTGNEQGGGRCSQPEQVPSARGSTSGRRRVPKEIARDSPKHQWQRLTPRSRLKSLLAPERKAGRWKRNRC